MYIIFNFGKIGRKGINIKGETSTALWEGSEFDEPWAPYLTNAFKAYEFFRSGHEYIILEGRVTIVDESTGRSKSHTRWQDGLHQAVEAKEQILFDNGMIAKELQKRVEILNESTTTASITFPVFFRYYHKLAGMSVSYNIINKYDDVLFKLI